LTGRDVCIACRRPRRPDPRSVIRRLHRRGIVFAMRSPRIALPRNEA
jgi:hypothetical protein